MGTCRDAKGGVMAWRAEGSRGGAAGGGWFAHSAIANTLLRLSDWPSYRVPRAECDGARRASPGVCPRRRHALCAWAARAGGRRAGGRALRGRALLRGCACACVLADGGGGARGRPGAGGNGQGARGRAGAQMEEMRSGPSAWRAAGTDLLAWLRRLDVSERTRVPRKDHEEGSCRAHQIPRRSCWSLASRDRV